MVARFKNNDEQISKLLDDKDNDNTKQIVEGVMASADNTLAICIILHIIFSLIYNYQFNFSLANLKFTAQRYNVVHFMIRIFIF